MGANRAKLIFYDFVIDRGLLLARHVRRQQKRKSVFVGRRRSATQPATGERVLGPTCCVSPTGSYAAPTLVRLGATDPDRRAASRRMYRVESDAEGVDAVRFSINRDRPTAKRRSCAGIGGVEKSYSLALSTVD